MTDNRNKLAWALFLAGSLPILFSCASDHLPQKQQLLPSAPTELSGIGISPSAIILTWHDNSDNETGFVVYRDWPTWSIVASLGVDVDFYVDSLLQDSTAYSYFIAAINPQGATFSRDTVTVFTLSYGHPPDIPAYPIPFDGITVNDTIVELGWQCSDPDGDLLRYELYVAIQATPVLYDSNLTQNSYLLRPLVPNSTYRWQVAAKDDQRHVTFGLVWSFHTSNQ